MTTLWNEKLTQSYSLPGVSSIVASSLTVVLCSKKGKATSMISCNCWYWRFAFVNRDDLCGRWICTLIYRSLNNTYRSTCLSGDYS